MTSLKVAVRVRPLSEKESFMGSGVVVDVQGKDILVTDVKVPENHGCDHRLRVHRFTFDFGFLSVDPAAKKYASQKVVYEEFGRVVLNAVLQGYNSCVIAYGPSGSGKTFTMMGSKEENGLTPRICEGLFTKLTDQGDNQLTFQIDISFMEIYNEQVYDLLQHRDLRNSRKPKLRIREHPIHGPFVEGLTTHAVKNIDDVCDLLARGNECRVNAATHIHDRSSRSHAIFTIRCSQACINESQPREVVSKLHLVDLAGSEKAAPEFCQSRVKEGGNINKSLVTLGNVISVLVEFSLRSKEGTSIHKQTYVPYRDSHLTWLLKDSLGGNSHTYMLAAISPSKECYIETVSTLRYAQRAKFVMNKPVVNEDPGTEMIRNLKTEVRRLRNLLITAERLNKKYVIKPLPDIIKLRSIMEESSRKVDMMTKHWFEKWLKTYDVVLNKFKKQQGLLPAGKQANGLRDGKLSKFNKPKQNIKFIETTPTKMKPNATTFNCNEEEFKDSSECIILCDDMVGFSKKKSGETEEEIFISDINSISNDRDLPDQANTSHLDSEDEGKFLAKRYLSNSDNVLSQRSRTLPVFRCLSLSGVNVTYPYCNYSWIPQINIHKKEPLIESPKTTPGNYPTTSLILDSSGEIHVKTTSCSPDIECHDDEEQEISNCQNEDFLLETQTNCRLTEENDDLNTQLYETESDDTIHSSNSSVDIEESECEPTECRNTSDETSDSTKEIVLADVNETTDGENQECIADAIEHLLISNSGSDSKNSMAGNEADKNDERKQSLSLINPRTIKFSEQVKEDSRNFLDLLTCLNPDSYETAAGIRTPQRKDSEIMSLLSFSSLDCPAWRSLDDFLGSCEETSSIQEDETPESLYRITSDIQRYGNRKASCSSIDSSAFSGFACANIAKETIFNEENLIENYEHDLKRRNSKSFRQVTFNDFANNGDYNMYPIPDIENGYEKLSNQNVVYRRNSVLSENQVVVKINDEQNCFGHLLNSRTIDSNCPKVNVNSVNVISIDQLNYCTNNVAVPILQDADTKNVNYKKFNAITPSLDVHENESLNLNCKQFNEANIWAGKSTHTFDSVSEVSKFKPFGLKLTKANLDLLAEKLNDCTETNKNYVNTCIAYALDVNNAKGILDVGADVKVGSETNFEPFSIKGHQIGKINETSGILAKIVEDEPSESFGSLKNDQNTDSPHECEKQRLLITETEWAQHNSEESPLISEESGYQTKSTRSMSEGNGPAVMWQNMEEAKGTADENLSINNSSCDSIQVSHSANIQSIIKDEKDDEMSNKEMESLMNSTFTSDSLDNFEQEMINWANKYLTRNKSISSGVFMPEKNTVSQSVDSQELGLDEFEFTTESSEFCNNNIICEQGTCEELNMIPDTGQNSSFRDNATLASSRSSSSDSITYVFVGTDDKGTPNTNVAADMSQYSSLPSSVSLDSLERNAFRPQMPCMSPRTLSIDSLIAEELLAQLRSGELPPACNNGKSLHTQIESFSASKSHFAQHILTETSEIGGSNYEANITETFSPESNCSFDILNSENNNKDKPNSDINFCTKNSTVKVISEVGENDFDPESRKLQRLPIGASECLVSQTHYAPTIVQKSATNSELYKFMETSTSDEKSELEIVSPYNSSASQDHPGINSVRTINFEKLARNYSNNIQLSYASKGNNTDLCLVPPPSSFTSDGKESSNERMSGHNQSTQTDDPYMSTSSSDDQKSSLPPNMLELILRMMEMMTETIKFLKNERSNPPSCCGGCTNRISKRNVKKQIDYYDELTQNFQKYTSHSSESNIGTQEIRRHSHKKCTNKYLTFKSIDDEREKAATPSRMRRRRKQSMPEANTYGERLDYSALHHHQTVPFDYQNKNLFSKTNATPSETKKTLSLTASKDSHRLLSLTQPESQLQTTRDIRPLRIKLNAVDGTNFSETGKSNSSSEVGEISPSHGLSTFAKNCQGVTEAFTSFRNRDTFIDYGKRQSGHSGLLECSPMSENASSSEGYLSSVSSTRTAQNQRSDDTDSPGFGYSVKESTIAKSLHSRARNLRPLVLNRCPEYQRAATPNTSWQNTSADSGAFFMDSPLAENKSFCNTNRSPETTNQLLQPLFKEMHGTSENATKAPFLKDNLPIRHLNSCDRSSPGIRNSSCSPFTTPASLSPASTQPETGTRKTNLKALDKRKPYHLIGHNDTDEEYLAIKLKTPVPPIAQASTSNPSSKSLNLTRNSSAEEFAMKLSKEDYRITREDIERILASIEADKQFLRRRRNPIFERRYSPEVAVRSPFEGERELFMSDSFKTLPKPVLYLSTTKDRSLVR